MCKFNAYVSFELNLIEVYDTLYTKYVLKHKYSKSTGKFGP